MENVNAVFLRFNTISIGFGTLFNLNMYIAFDEEKNTSLIG